MKIREMWLSVKNVCFVRILWAIIGVFGGILLTYNMCADSKPFMEFFADWCGYETNE